MNFSEMEAVFDAKIASFIKFKSRVIVTSLGFPSYERDDVEQKLMLALWERRNKWDPGKGCSWQNFSRMIIENESVNIIKEHKAKKRCHQNCSALDDETLEVFGRIANAPSGYKINQKHAASDEDPMAKVDLQIDFERFVGKLPDKLKPFAVALQEFNIIETAKLLGVSRATVKRRKIQLREQLQALGFEERRF